MVASCAGQTMERSGIIGVNDGPGSAPLSGPLHSLFGPQQMTHSRTTIIHNVGDDPIVLEQSDGSHITVPAGAQRHADLASEFDSIAKPQVQPQP